MRCPEGDFEAGFLLQSEPQYLGGPVNADMFGASGSASHILGGDRRGRFGPARF